VARQARATALAGISRCPSRRMTERSTARCVSLRWSHGRSP